MLKPEMYATVSISVGRAQGAGDPALGDAAPRRSDGRLRRDRQRRPTAACASSGARRRRRGRRRRLPAGHPRPRARASSRHLRRASCSPECSDASAMIQKLVALALAHAGRSSAARARRSSSLGLYCVQASSTSRRIRTRCRRWSRSSRSRTAGAPRRSSATSPFRSRSASSGMPGLDHIRSQSLFGLSRREVLLHVGHRLRGRAAGGHQPPPVRPAPAGLQAQLSPWNAIGEIFRYQRRRQGLLADASSRRRRTGSSSGSSSRCPASSTSSSFGGETKQYHVEVDPFRLQGHERHARRS